MISNTLTAPADAVSPDADRAGPVAPKNIARLLCVLTTLIGFGRHIAATIERRAARPGAWLYTAVFGTTKIAVIQAHLHRGILRATALESLLLARAAAGHDVAPAPLRTPAAPGTDANGDRHDEPFNVQVERLTAQRAKYDAPADRDHLPGLAEIEAEVRAHPIGFTIDAIRRDFGVIAIMCTYEFWDTLTEAIAAHAHSPCIEDKQPAPATCAQQPDIDANQEHAHRKPDRRNRVSHASTVVTSGEAADESPSQESRLSKRPGDLESAPLALLAMFLCCTGLIPSTGPNPHRSLWFKRGERRIDRFRAAALARPRHHVPIPKGRATVPLAATGPPLRAAIRRAA